MNGLLLILVYISSLLTQVDKTITIPREYFGMHIHYAGTTTAWPAIPFGSWRLWDASVTWNNLEPEKGKWNFDLLDKYVDLAQRNKVEILLPLGLTPVWASARPKEEAILGKGLAAEPSDINDWKEYVRTVCNRYKGKIKNYEIWNEPFSSTKKNMFFSGTVEEMIELSKTAYSIIKEVDSTNVVVSPSMTEFGMLPWFEDYIKKGGGESADVIGYHFYVPLKQPEEIIPLIKKVKSILSKYKIHKPIWDSELGWSNKMVFSSNNEEASFVARSYILNWAFGVSRLYWYAWDNHTWVGLEMTEKDSKTLKPAAVAYSVIHDWLINSEIRDCQLDSTGKWSCKLYKNKKYFGTVFWDPTGKNFLRPTKKDLVLKNIFGKTLSLKKNKSLKLDYSPVLVLN